ncbi:hypothetical protein ASD11_17250 [Aeromicrobium sp. Root495]|uniref:2-phosphosulfolactate phosphatase n=1 Tax=Aeromicrobium sp. Root495 TaxID=1736550 RepID=UPI0006FBB1E3|nr:2-phosphosulfolactate phosphatase [Aeromicrobium sp. Root495]KQY55299.1 hypothetical protein ASD11_17250 [Aeromicrobium sp. Root495]
MDQVGTQGSYAVRFEWGVTGGLTIAEGADVAVVVDVLDDTTRLSALFMRESGLPVSVDGMAIAPLVNVLDEVATTVALASLRNARAVADWLAREHDPETATVAVIACGEHWPDGTLRPGLEDLWGAGAVLSALEDLDWPGLSPEAAMAADAYRLIAGREPGHLLASSSGEAHAAAGRELALDMAAQVSVDSVVPILSSRGFVPAP